MKRILAITLGVVGIVLCGAVFGQTAGFYILPTVTANLPASDFPITVTGCTGTLQPFSTSSGAQLCQFNSPATITATSGTTTCQLNVTGTVNSFSITGGTCTNQNTNPTDPTPTVLIQGGFS